MAVGSVGRPFADVVEEYERRAARYWKTQVVEVTAGCKGKPTPERTRAAEAERVLARIPPRSECIALTRTGKSMSSTDLAAHVARAALHSVPCVTFVIGGASGLARSVIDRSTSTLSLSPLTLPHELARLVLAEQLYRAGTILRGEPYHKGSALRRPSPR